MRAIINGSLCIGTVMYFVSSLGGVAVVKFLNYEYCYRSFSVFALLSRSTWIWSLILHYYSCCNTSISGTKKPIGSTVGTVEEEYDEKTLGGDHFNHFEGDRMLCDKDDGRSMTPTATKAAPVALRRTSISLAGLLRKQFWLYVTISAGLASVELLNSFSMTHLPGSFYALLKGSDIGFSMIISRLFLRKTYKWGQFVGSSLVMTGIGLVFWIGSPSPKSHNRSSNNENLDSSSDKTLFSSIAVVSTMCLLGAALNATCTVVTEMTLKRSLKEEENRILSSVNRNDRDHDSERIKFILSNAYQMWTTMLAFIMLLPVLLFTYRFDDDDASSNTLTTNIQKCQNYEDDEQHSQEFDEQSSHSKGPVAMITCLLLLLGISRFAERLSKHWITVTDSAVTFSLVQAARRLMGVLILAAMFREKFPMGMVIGTICSSCGFAIHFWSTNNPSTTTASNTLGTDRFEYELVSTNSNKFKRRLSDQIPDDKI
mmetsp:Transcript_34068/g.81935  ORF Transcript_34068/g.81935 Transcript_34068/m.81935 type:complete len:485 (+) Transcript_34068:49-1503(+)